MTRRPPERSTGRDAAGDEQVGPILFGGVGARTADVECEVHPVGGSITWHFALRGHVAASLASLRRLQLMDSLIDRSFHSGRLPETTLLLDHRRLFA
jgi:hypothetical protein